MPEALPRITLTLPPGSRADIALISAEWRMKPAAAVREAVRRAALAERPTPHLRPVPEPAA